MRITLARVWLDSARAKKVEELTLDCVQFRNLLILFISRNHELTGDWLLCDGILYTLVADRINKRSLQNNAKMRKLEEIFGLMKQDRELRQYWLGLKEQRKRIGNMSIVQNEIRKTVGDYKSWLKALRKWKQDKSRFTGMPRPPKLKKLSNIDRYMIGLSKNSFRVQGRVMIMKLKRRKSGKWKVIRVKLPDYVNNITSVRLVYYMGGAYIDFVGERYIEKLEPLGHEKAGIDLGVENIMTIVSTKKELGSLVVRSSTIKAYNQWYNKLLAQLRSEYDRTMNELKKRYDLKLVRKAKKIRRRIKGLSIDRKKWVENMAHQLSKAVVLYLWQSGHDAIYVGKSVMEVKSKGVNIGRKNNQMFVQIPFKLIIDKMKYKAEWFGMRVVELNEAYTSKVSCVSEDIWKVRKGEVPMSGDRVSRSLFKDKVLNKVWHADVNGAFNILRIGAGIKKLFNKLDKVVMRKLANPIVMKWYEFVQYATSESVPDRRLVTPR